MGGTGSGGSFVGRDVDEVRVPGYTCGEEIGIMSAGCCCG